MADEPTTDFARPVGSPLTADDVPTYSRRAVDRLVAAARADERERWVEGREYGVFRDDTGEQVGIGTTMREDAAHEDYVAWARDGYAVTLRRRPIGTWTRRPVGGWSETRKPPEKG